MQTILGHGRVAAILALALAAACELPMANDSDEGPNGGDDTYVPPGGPCKHPEAQGSIVPALVAVHTQADVDALAGCTEVGSLQIMGTSDVVNLDALSSLTAVRAFDGVVLGGMVSISNNTGLTDMGGLRNLRVVEWGLSVTSNPSLRQVNLGAVESVGTPGEYSSGVAIQSNAVATVVDLGALKSVVNSFSIIGNDAMDDLRLGALEEVLSTDGDLIVGQNPRLSRLALTSLEAIEGHFTVNDNDALEEIQAPRLASVAGWIGVSRNDSLAALDLPMLSGDVDAVNVVENQGLISISIPGLVAVKDRGWDDTMVEGDFTIGDNAALMDLDFAALSRVDVSLEIHDNPNLPTSIAEALQAQVESSGGIGSGASVWGNGPG